MKQIGQDVPWLSAMCGYTLTPQHHEVLVIEDMLEDARCAINEDSQSSSCEHSVVLKLESFTPVSSSTCSGNQAGVTIAVCGCDDV